MRFRPEEVLDFWFSPPIKRRWFSATEELDAAICLKYEMLWNRASTGACEGWREQPLDCLALVIVLDQFPLNMFRDQARSYSTGPMALQIAKTALRRGFDVEMDADQRLFLYLPFMHSEDAEDQEESVRLFSQSGLEDALEYAQHHHGVVSRFGRFPHRNQALGRESTPEEIAYLDSARAFRG